MGIPSLTGAGSSKQARKHIPAVSQPARVSAHPASPAPAHAPEPSQSESNLPDHRSQAWQIPVPLPPRPQPKSPAALRGSACKTPQAKQKAQALAGVAADARFSYPKPRQAPTWSCQTHKACQQAPRRKSCLRLQRQVVRSPAKAARGYPAEAQPSCCLMRRGTLLLQSGCLIDRPQR